MAPKAASKKGGVSKAAPVRVRKAPATVPEGTLKKNATVAALKAKREVRAAANKKKTAVTRKLIFKRAEAYAKEYKDKASQVVRMKRQAKNSGNYFMPAMPKVLFVIRVQGIMRCSPKVRKCLQLLRLRRVHTGVFIRANAATLAMLQIVEPYITYGEPSLSSIRQLIYKRGFGKVNKQRIPLTHNSVVSDNLGKHDIICVEDLIHEIATVGSSFKETANFLWPFKLSSALGGFTDKKNHFLDGGDAGQRYELINKLIQRMN